MRSPTSLRTRLVLSHLLVALISIGFLVLFAASAILNAARNELENNLDTIALTASDSLEEPLKELLYGQGNIYKVQQTFLQLVAAHPELHYTVYNKDGIPILDNLEDVNELQEVETPIEVREALYNESGEGSTTRKDSQGENTLYLTRRIDQGDEVYGVIRVALQLKPALTSVRPLLMVLYLFSFSLVVLSAIFAWFWAKNITKPIQSLTDAATQLAKGDLSTRVDPVGPQELQHLGEVFNDMADRLQGYVEELRAFAANASHELRTPLTIVKLRVEALRSGAINDPPVANRFLGEIEGEVDRLARMVTDLLDLSRMEAGLVSKRRSVLDMNSIVDDVCSAFNIRAVRAGVEIKTNTYDDLPAVFGNEDQLHRVLYNLVDNALRYTPKGGTIEVSLFPINEGEAIRLSVKDTGPGIAPQHIPHIFERFYRAEATRPRFASDNTSSGSGLGLAIAKSIVEFHGGKIGVTSKLGEGSTFYFELPAMH